MTDALRELNRFRDQLFGPSSSAPTTSSTPLVSSAPLAGLRPFTEQDLESQRFPTGSEQFDIDLDSMVKSLEDEGEPQVCVCMCVCVFDFVYSRCY